MPYATSSHTKISMNQTTILTKLLQLLLITCTYKAFTAFIEYLYTHSKKKKKIQESHTKILDESQHGNVIAKNINYILYMLDKTDQ